MHLSLALYGSFRNNELRFHYIDVFIFTMIKGARNVVLNIPWLNQSKGSQNKAYVVFTYIQYIISEPHSTDYKAFKGKSLNCSPETNSFNGWNIITFNIIIWCIPWTLTHLIPSSASLSNFGGFSIGWVSCKRWCHLLLWWLLLLMLWALTFFWHLFYFWLLRKMCYTKISSMQKAYTCYWKQTVSCGQLYWIRIVGPLPVDQKYWDNLS